MRILFIATEYMNRRLKYIELMNHMGHEVVLLQLPKFDKAEDALSSAVQKYKPDLVFTRFIETFEVNSESRKLIKSKNIPMMLYGTYQPKYPNEKYDSTISDIDFPFLQNREHVNYFLNKGIEAFYMPLAFHPEQYYDMSHMDEDINISFAGNVKLPADPQVERRIKYVQPLREYGINVFGERFTSVLSDIPVHPYSTHAQQRNIYGRSKINLDIPNVWVNDGRMHFKNRFFEIPATNKFLLELRTDEFLDIFDEDTIGYYDDNIESLKEAVERYLRDKDARVAMAAKSHQLVHEKHTFKHRFDEMFEIFERGGV